MRHRPSKSRGYSRARMAEIKVKRDYNVNVKSRVNCDNLLVNKESASTKSFDTADEEEQKQIEEVITPEEIEIISQIGSGSFAKVYLCRSMITNKLYAMKVINKEKLKSTSLRKYSISEKNILGMIQHKFIVKFYACFQTKSFCFLLMEYGPGKDLSTHLDCEGCFSEAKCRFYLLECILAINALHKKGIIYRDLKPNNIILDCNGDIRLIDFNLSKSGFHSNLKRTSSFCGSYAYMPPEVIKKQSYGISIDWYLCGVLLFEMISGLPPYFEQNTKKLQKNILNNKLEIPEDITDECKDLLQKLLNKEPLKRLGYKGGAEEILNHPWFDDIKLSEISSVVEGQGTSFIHPKMKISNTHLEDITLSLDIEERKRIKGLNKMYQTQISQMIADPKNKIQKWTFKDI